MSPPNGLSLPSDSSTIAATGSLDAWCHLRNGLRSFSLDRLHPVEIYDTAARDIADGDLDAHYADAYGIFAGPANQTAVLRFSTRRRPLGRRWHWHPRQQARVLDDGALELRVPYGVRAS